MPYKRILENKIESMEKSANDWIEKHLTYAIIPKRKRSIIKKKNYL